MPYRRIAALLLVLTAMTAFLACKQAEPAAEPEPEGQTVVLEIGATPAPTAEPVPKPTDAPTPAPTETPEPTATPVPAWFPTDTPEEDGLYKLVVYFGSQSVVAYRAENGRWVEERVMICSSGKTTPEGTYRVYKKYRYHSLYGAKGQYCSRIVGHFLFHSVPIDENARKVEEGKSRMKLDEYEKLGTRASDGCIRLLCRDAKWVYDNCDKTTVVVMTADSGPVPPAAPALIAGAPYETEPGYGWDPTDPDPENPYHAVYGAPDVSADAAEGAGAGE